MERAGLRRVQQSVAPLFERTRRFRVYQSWVIPGLLQSAACTRAVLSTVAHLRDVPDDIEDAVAVRMDRQRILYAGDHRFAMLVTVGLPPLEIAYWLIKPPSLVHGTWDKAKEAAAWLGESPAEHSYRFACSYDRDTTRLSTLANSAAEQLESGRDVSYGFYLEHPSYLSLAVVTCSPNHSKPELACPGPAW